MSCIDYIEGNEKQLDLIKPLWEKLNEHHRLRSVYFSERYSKLTFEERARILLENVKEGKLRVDLAKESTANQLAGYCVSSINPQGTGEIDSLYVESGYRKMGIGGQLMIRALEWMDKNMAASKAIGVAAGNEEAFEFYARYGFYPCMITLRQK